MKRRSQFILGFSFVSLAAASIAAPLPPPPIEAFARLEQMRNPTLSPDGRYIAYITSVDGQRVAVTKDLTTAARPVAVLKPDSDNKLDLSWCHWGNDTRLVCGFTAAIIFRPGMVLRHTKMAAVDVDGKNFKVLMNSQRVDDALSRDDVLDWTWDKPRTVLVQSVENRKETGTLLVSTDSTPAIFELDIYTGGLSRVMRAQPNLWDYRSDSNGNVRLASGILGTKRIIRARMLGSDEWRTLTKVEVFENDGQFIPQRVIPGTNRAYATSYNNGRNGLWEIDLEDKVAPKLIFEHPVVDIDSFLSERVTGKLLAYMYQTDRPFSQYEDDRLGGIMRGVNKSLSGTFNAPVSYTDDFKKLIIRSSSDVNAASFYLFDATTGKLVELGRAYPELDPQAMGRMQSIQYPARDGTKIPGYLTVPVNVRAEKLPLIVMPHGGPIARDSWSFDFLQQFLVSRGYAVLKMNFRGSSGYGNDWFSAAHQDWGGLTYSDITDGARWAVAQGIADPNRVCIVGWSFGGYAALLGATRNGDLFKCSVSIAGLSDLTELLHYRRNFVNSEVVEKQIGYDNNKIKEDSPVNHAKDVKIPLLLIHGTHDAQAPFEQSTEMARALKSADKNFKFVEIKDADHPLWRPAEREIMLREVEEFLKTHLGPGAIPQS